MRRTIQISIAFATMAFMLLLLVHVAAQRDDAVTEADGLRKQLAEQKVLVIETAAAEPVEETTGEPMTRQDKIPTDADYVKADEMLGMTSLGTFTISHYCPCHECTNKYPNDANYGITSTGHAAIPYRTVAVDPTVIPYGTVLYLDYGDGTLHEVIADDCGGDIKGHRLDLYAGNHEEALNLGVRSATVYTGGAK